MGKIIPLYNSCYIRLSTGSFADMNTSTIEEAADAFDNLLSMIVMEHFKEILKTATEDQNYNQAVEMIEEEVHYLVENEFDVNPKGSLHWILNTLALGRLSYFIEHVTKDQEKRNAQ